MTTTPHIHVKINLTIQRPSIKKYDMKEVFHITRASFSGLKHEKKNVRGNFHNKSISFINHTCVLQHCITCYYLLKVSDKTLEQGVKYVQS